MKRYMILLVLSITLVGCSSSSQAKAPDEAVVEAPVVSVQDNSKEPVSNTEETAKTELSGNSRLAVKQGSNLELPSGFPSNIVSIADDANITDTVVDGESFYIAYQTNKSVGEVKKTYKRLLEGSKLMGEDSQGDDYYTISCNKDNTNIYISITKFSTEVTGVAITACPFDMAILELGENYGGSSGSMPSDEDSGQ